MRPTAIFLLFFCLSFSLISATNGPHTLQQCINIALLNNPQLKAQKHQIQASEARYQQARAWSQPELSFDSDLQPDLFKFDKSGESYLGISQLIEFPGKRLLRSKIAKRETEESHFDYEWLKQDIIYQVKGAFFGLLLAQELEKLAQENFTLASDFMSKAEEKYLSGDIAKMESLRAKVEAAKADHIKNSAIRQSQLSKARLNFLLARDKHQPINIKGTLHYVYKPMDLRLLIKLCNQYHPLIKKAKKNLQKEKTRKTQALWSYLPDFSLGVAKHKIVGEGDFWDVTLSFEVPLFFWQKQKGEVAEASANSKAAAAGLKFTELSVGLEIESSYNNAVSYKNQIQLFEREVLKEADEVYRMAMISYQEGKISSIALIDTRRTLIDLKKSYLETLLQYHLAMADLEKLIGRSIEGGKK